jgi:DNA-directed RNA polymerase specialized sigma24 family protein
MAFLIEGFAMTSDVGDSVTQWITRIKGGGDGVAQKLWERYYAALVRLARAKLKKSRRVAADEEDVALSAFDSFFAAASKGRYPQINDRNDLWKLLITITKRKVLDRIQSEIRIKRGAGRVLREADLALADGESAGLEEVPGSEPTPEFAAMVAEEYQRLLDALPDAIHRKIAVLRMEGWNDDEIAEQIGCVRRTVGRKLQVIRNTWSAEAGP